MTQTPQIDSLKALVAEIERLETARDLLSELWFMANILDKVPFDLEYKIDKYFGLLEGRDE